MLTRRARRLGAALAGLAAACTLAFPATAANAASGSYSPNPHEWYFSKWAIQQQVWPLTEGAGVTIAVVDGGVQASLPDLQGVIEPGADMVGSSNGEQDHAPNGGHGTEMAELIAGQGIGSSQFGTAPVGIAPQSKILPVRVVNSASDPQKTLPEGIKFAVDHGARVINISLGYAVMTSGSCDAPLQQAIGYALAHDVVVVAASGDTNLGGTGPEEPATCAGVLAVGGVEQNGSTWKYSTQGANVSVAAPGDHMYVTSDTGQQATLDSSGTSGAAALTSAAAALIRSKNPSMPWYTVDQRLINTAVHGSPVPNDQVGYGIINISKAVQVSKYPVPASAPNPPYARYQAWLKSTGQSAAGQPAGGQSTSGTSSGGSGVLWIVAGVVVVLVIAAFLIIALASRNRRGPRGPQGPRAPAGYPPNAYAPPPGQYPPGQYPQPGPYAPPGQPQYPQPGQYQPPGQ